MGFGHSPIVMLSPCWQSVSLSSGNIKQTLMLSGLFEILNALVRMGIWAHLWMHKNFGQVLSPLLPFYHLLALTGTLFVMVCSSLSSLSSEMHFVPDYLCSFFWDSRTVYIGNSLSNVILSCCAHHIVWGSRPKRQQQIERLRSREKCPLWKKGQGYNWTKIQYICCSGSPNFQETRPGIKE